MQSARNNQSLLLRSIAGFIICVLSVTSMVSAVDLVVNAGDESAILSHTYVETGLAYNHPSGITITKEGSIIAATSCGESEGEDTDICIYRKPANQSQWDRVETI
ncbi:MAG: hypothetical protein GF401_00420, partial [Chitinivibrionales bacterium]|nr:hypothetical protein [Chitinivibrionales bacterium]